MPAGSVKDRIIQYVQFKGLDVKSFEANAKLSNGFVGKTGESIRRTSIEKIRNVYPDLNIEWVMTGTGEMLKDAVEVSAPGKPAISDKRGAPYYNIDFKGGFDLVFNDQTIRPDFYIDFPPFNDVDGWVNVTGKSMGPLIAHGDIVALKRQDGWQDFLLEGEIYAIVTKNGFRTIKIISAGKDSDHYTLRPYNKSDEFNPQPIRKDMIVLVFRVMACMKKFF